jgi:hypothetical protein
MAKGARDAYRRGYTDGLRVAKKIRWQRSLIGTLWKGASYRPDRPDPDYIAEYDEGFRQAMEDMSAVEWSPPQTRAKADEGAQGVIATGEAQE